MLRRHWKLLGLAGIAGVAATGVVVARKRRDQVDYDPGQLRDRLHDRLGDVKPATGTNGAHAADATPAG
jgi:hypothetical protein